MASAIKFLCIGVLIVFLYSLEGTNADVTREPKPPNQDCSTRHNWPLHVCPDGDGWACWRDQKRRDVNCKEQDWGNRVSFPNTRGFGWCYCCGRCRVPENIFA